MLNRKTNGPSSGPYLSRTNKFGSWCGSDATEKGMIIRSAGISVLDVPDIPPVPDMTSEISRGRLDKTASL